MKFLDGIKNTIGDYFLKKELMRERKNKTFMSLENARTIGILFELDKPENFELIKKYVFYLREMRKKVKAIGFYNSRQLSTLAYPKLEYDIFNRKTLNWYNRPVSPFITNFINEEYDILIDLNLCEQFPLKFLAAASKAKCKVGQYSDHNKAMYDVLIKTDSTSGLKYFMRQVDTYLAMINNKETA